MLKNRHDIINDVLKIMLAHLRVDDNYVGEKCVVGVFSAAEELADYMLKNEKGE